MQHHLDRPGGYTLYAESHGEGPALVFLNGLSQSTANWMSHTRAFRDRYRVVVFDARGQGRSTLGQGALSLAGHVEDLRELLHSLDISQAHICGFSHGARVALAFAAAAPEMTSSLILTSTGADADGRRRAIIESWRHILRLGGVEALAWASIPTILGARFLGELDGQLEPLVRATVQRNQPDGLVALLEGMLGYPPADLDAAAVTARALLITSLEDPLVSAESATRLASLLNAQHEVWTGAGHTIPIELPERWRTNVSAFLEG
jgi:3-oxoadipate enol-lactonase